MRGMTKMICCLAAACLMLAAPAQALASVVDNGAQYPVATDQLPGWPKSPEIASETGVLMDFDTGAILYDKGMDEKRYPASITKIMTALLAIEKGEIDGNVTFTEACLPDQAPDSSNAAMKVGEVLTLRQCLNIMLLVSANDVATQIAVQIAGDVASFAELMNQRAAELGCANTHFVNASGMPDDNQYTTAHDMALIFQEALRHDEFREIIGTPSFVLPPTNMNSAPRTFNSHQETIVPGSQFYYKGCIGGKTGGSTASMNTLVNGASRDGMTLIAVTMRTDIMQAWKDQIALLDYGFGSFRREETEGGSVVLPKEMSLEELKTEETEQEGKIAVKYFAGEDHYLGSALQTIPEETETPEATAAVTKKAEKNSAKAALAQKPAASLDKKFVIAIFVMSGLILAALVAMIVTLIKRR